MRRAIANAAAVRRFTSPNPWVGAVVVTPDGECFDGATQPPGGAHAEIMALRAAGSVVGGRGEAAGFAGAGGAAGPDEACEVAQVLRGAMAWADSTLITTLEPCSHHGRTPPCVDAIIAAGIRRVVIGVLDPDPKVAGRGLASLQDAGLSVSVGVGADEVRTQLAPYLHHRITGRPFIVLKLAATLDGRIAASDRTSQWITGPEARADAHRLRAESDAILVGAGTVRADNPGLTVRHVDGRDPIRVVLGHAPPEALVHPCLERFGQIGPILDELGARGVLQVLVEGGATVAHQFHHAGLVDRYVMYLAPALAGGDDGLAIFRGAGAASIADVWRGDIQSVDKLGPDLCIVMHPAGRP